MPDATNEPTENALVNEPYERIDRLNYKDRADRNVDHGDELFTRRGVDALNAQSAITQQQRELFEDVRSQRDQLFAQFLQMNANTIDAARAASSAHADLVSSGNANHLDLARRTAADAQTMSVKELQPKETNENISESIGAKVAQDVVPEINNAVKMAAADVASSTAGSQGLTAYNSAAATNMAQLTAVMQQAAQAMQEAAKAVTEMNK